MTTKDNRKRKRPITQLIFDVLHSAGRPLQLLELVDLIDSTEKYSATVYSKSISVLLNREVSANNLKRIKLPMSYSFVGLPEWEYSEDNTVVNGAIFNPLEKIFKKSEKKTWSYWRERFLDQETRKKIMDVNILLPQEEGVFRFLEKHINL